MATQDHDVTAASSDTAANRFLILAGVAVFALAVLFALFFVPMNMDEAGIFHMLACLDHPMAEYNIFREACFVKNDLTLLGGIHLIRPQFYTGLFHSILYAPFFNLIHAPAGQYVFGLTFLLAFATLMSRLTTKPKLAFALILGFFPFVFQFIHDTGPVKYEILLFPLSALALKKMLQDSSPLRYGIALVLALLLAAGVEDKAFFLYLLPSLAIFALGVASAEHTPKSLTTALLKTRGPLTVLVGVFAVLALLLLFSVNKDGLFYIQWLMRLTGKTLFADWLSPVPAFLLYWPMYAHYHFDIEPWTLRIVAFELVTLAFGVGFCITAAKQNAAQKDTLQLKLLLASAAILLVIFAIMTNAWAGHHFVFLWVPLLYVFLLRLEKMQQAPRLLFGGAFLALNLLSVLALTQYTNPVKINAQKDMIFSFLNDKTRAESSIYNFSTWGGYYIQALYGPRAQLATYTEPLEPNPSYALHPEQAAQLLEIAKLTGRKIYTICYEPGPCSKEHLETAFSNKLTFHDALPGLRNWHVFEGNTVDTTAKAKPSS